MTKQSKRIKAIGKKIDQERRYNLDDALVLLKECPEVKFDQSVDIALKMGVDPRKSDQNVRGTVTLPSGTGKTIIVVVFAKGPKIQEALDAGADHAGDTELFEKVKAGWTDFDSVVATPDMMREVGKLGKVLGPRGLMPSPKAGTVTNDIAKAVQDLKGGKIEFKLDRHGVINTGVGKISFTKEQLGENIKALLLAIKQAKPPSAKGHYFSSLVLSSTMGPGLKIDIRDITEAAA